MARREERTSARRTPASLPLPLWVLWTVAPLTTLLLGGVPIFATAAATAAAALGAIACARHPSTRRRRVPAPALILAGLAAYCLLQSIPLPLAWLTKLSPSAADVWQRSLLPLGRTVTSGSLSLDPGASSLEAAKWAAYACILYVSAFVTRSRGARACVYVIVGSATLLALVTVGHQIVEAERVFGLYKPVYAFRPGHVGPLLNPNHLAGYLVLGALCALGLTLSPRRTSWRWVFATAAVVDIGVLIRTASRGGVLALLFGLCLLGGLVLLARLKEPHEAGRARRFTGIGIVGGTALVGAVLASFGFDRLLWAELADPDTGKLQLVYAVKPLVLDHLPFGVGRGAFESVFEAYRPAIGAHKVFTHPENFAVQWLAEWGVVGGVALLVLAWQFRPWRLGLLRSETVMGAAAGAFAILLQNVADFSLEVPAVGIAFAIVLGALSGNVRGAARPTAQEDERGSAARLGVALGAFAFACAVVGSWRGAPTLLSARAAIQRSLDAKDAPAEAVRADVVHMMSRYPAEYYFPLAGAVLAARTGETPMPWIQRALERGPTIGRTHLLLAQVLQRRGALNQALFELRLAVEYEPLLIGAASVLALTWSREPTELLRAVSDDTAGAIMLEALANQALTQGDRPLTLALDAEMLRRDPAKRLAHTQIAEISLTALEQDTCDDRVACEGAVTEHGEALATLLPTDSAGEQILARLAIFESEPRLARDILRRGCQKPEGLLGCLGLLARVEEPGEVGKTLDRYLALSCDTAEKCADANTWVASFHASRGSFAQAYGAAERAARRAPSDARWLAAAGYAEQAGMRPQAVRALEEVLRMRGGNDAAIKARIEADRGPPR